MEKKRTSKTQFKIYLKYLREHKILITGKLHPTSDPQDLEAIWLQLTQALNFGPVRDKMAWKKVFTEWKGLCRKKARESKALSELEEQVLQLTGSGAVTGLDLAELGPSTSTTSTSKKIDKTSDELETPREAETPREKEAPWEKEIAKTKPKRKGTGDQLCDAYQKAVQENGDKLEAISLSIMEVAKAIHRYCDIVEASNTIQYVEEDVEEDETN